MRIAIVSDIHGNRTALEAVLADLQQTAPDLVLHGGDLASGGASPVGVIDRIRDLGWNGVVGNTDEMLFRPESLTAFAQQSPPSLQPLFAAIEMMAACTRDILGEERLAWLRSLPSVERQDSIALLHARPGDLWRAPAPDASDSDLASVYSPLRDNIVIYGHIHLPYIRRVEGKIIANSGSVGLPYDGDRRASYLVVDDGTPSIRRVAYDLDKELQELARCRLPYSEWIARSLRSARPEMP